MKITKFLLPLIISSISGCVTIYQDQTSGQTASIEFINNSTELMYTEIYDGAQNCTDRKHIGNLGVAATNPNKKIVVKADVDTAFTAHISTGSSRGVMFALGGALALVATDGLYSDCTPSIMFKPEAGVAYEFTASTIGNECKFKFSKKLENNKEVILKSPADFSIRKWNRAFGESGPWCTKD